MALQIFYRVLSFSTNSFHFLLSWVSIPVWYFYLLYIFSNIILPACFWSSYWPSRNVFPGVYCLYHSLTLHPFNVTNPAQSLWQESPWSLLLLLKLLASLNSSILINFIQSSLSQWSDRHKTSKSSNSDCNNTILRNVIPVVHVELIYVESSQ